MSYIQIRNKKWNAEIDLHGGRIVSLQHGDRKLLGTYHRIDGKMGNTHVCIPSFGSEGKEFGLPFHGPARNQVWKIVGREGKAQDRELKIECTLPKTEKYRADLLVRQTFFFQDGSFVHKVSVKNLGGENVPVNIGIHNYLSTLRGWDGVRLNDIDISLAVKANGIVALQKNNKIDLPGEKPIYLDVEGVSNAVIWTGFRESEYDTTYVCIEPIQNIEAFAKGSENILTVYKTTHITQIIRLS